MSQKTPSIKIDGVEIVNTDWNRQEQEIDAPGGGKIKVGNNSVKLEGVSITPDNIDEWTGFAKAMKKKLAEEKKDL